MARKRLDTADGCVSKAADVEGEVVRSLALLTRGDAAEFCHNSDPPRDIADWLATAELQPVRGLLMATLRRWHELQQLENRS